LVLSWFAALIQPVAQSIIIVEGSRNSVPASDRSVVADISSVNLRESSFSFVLSAE
jgi:hypothetical protein